MLANGCVIVNDGFPVCWADHRTRARRTALAAAVWSHAPSHAAPVESRDRAPQHEDVVQRTRGATGAGTNITKTEEVSE